MADIEALAREVAVAQDRLELAKRKLLAALGDVSVLAPVSGPGSRPPTRKARPVSQQVAEAIAAGPKSKAELRAIVGDKHEAALHSALKKGAEAGKWTSVDGKWVAAALAKTAPKKKGPRP